MEKNITKCIQLKNELDNLRPLKPEDEIRIMQKFRLDWNYHSNHLEGNTLTYGETKALILFGITAQGKPLKDHFEVTGHNEAVNWVIDIVKQNDTITENFIRQIHTLLLKESYEKVAITPDGQRTSRKIHVGQYKTSPNHVKTVTGEIFHFASPEETPAKMYDLMNWYHTEIEKENPNLLIIAALFHYKFIRIHPFDDGNGRTARILMNFILMQGGYPPVIIKTEDKEAYFRALRQADAGILEAFIDYIADNLVHSLTIMIAGAKGESIEEPDDITKEIKLLEQQLNAVGRNKVEKNTQQILNTFENSIIPLIEVFIQKCHLLDKFYVKNQFSIKIDNTSFSLNDIEKTIQKAREFLLNIDSMELSYHYEFFRIENFDEFSFTSKIYIDFQNTMVSIKNNSETVCNLLYNEAISKEQIHQLVDTEIRSHKLFIEKKIQSKK